MTRGRLVVLAAALLLAAGCAPDPKDFARNAEGLIRDGLSADPGGQWEVTCTPPGEARLDATFTCRATGGTQSTTLTFTGKITGRSKYVVTQDVAPGG